MRKANMAAPVSAMRYFFPSEEFQIRSRMFIASAADAQPLFRWAQIKGPDGTTVNAPGKV